MQTEEVPGVLKEKTLRAVECRRGGDCDVGISGNLAHFGRLTFPVVRVLLDDAQGVDPEVSYPEIPVEPYGVLKCLWYRFPGYGYQMLLEIVSCRRERLLFAPAMAESCVSAEPTVRFRESNVTRCRANI